MKNSIAVVLLLIPFFNQAQDFIVVQNDTINRVDKNGKQGAWKFYDDEAGVKVVMKFTSDTANDTILFYQNDLLRLVYVKTKRDTTFYTYYDGKFSCSCFFTLRNIQYCSQDDAVRKQIDRFILYEIYPTYYGGSAAMYGYLAERVKGFPVDETGTVKMGFTLDKTGKPSWIKVNESTNEKLNSYCIRAMEEMPRWQAGYQGGAVVTVPMILPIVCK
jgi:hypothetical protein